MKRFLMYYGIGIVFKIAKFIGIYEKPQPLRYSMEEVEKFLNDPTKLNIKPKHNYITLGNIQRAHSVRKYRPTTEENQEFLDKYTYWPNADLGEAEACCNNGISATDMATLALISSGTIYSYGGLDDTTTTMLTKTFAQLSPTTKLKDAFKG